jgi:hypothetical protein
MTWTLSSSDRGSWTYEACNSTRPQKPTTMARYRRGSISSPSSAPSRSPLASRSRCSGSTR